ERMAKVGLYAISKSTTLESNKSLGRTPWMPTMSDNATNTTARETDTSLVLRKNPSHNVLAHIEEAKNSLAELATLYLVAEAAGHAQATLDAKRRDLQRFLSFYQRSYWISGSYAPALPEKRNSLLR